MRKHKYSAIATLVDGIKFPSRKEARRYQELRLLEKAGEIKELELQPKYPLYVASRQGAALSKVCDYIADFRYREGPKGILTIEDVKGIKTPVYRLKKKMFEAQYGLTITEI